MLCTAFQESRGATGVPQHQGDEVDEELDVYLGLLFEGSVELGEEKAIEVRL